MLEGALAYKEEGNRLYGHRRYKHAILSYTEGIKLLAQAILAKGATQLPAHTNQVDSTPPLAHGALGAQTQPVDEEGDLLANLFANRAAAHFLLGSSFDSPFLSTRYFDSNGGWGRAGLDTIFTAL